MASIQAKAKAKSKEQRIEVEGWPNLLCRISKSRDTIPGMTLLSFGNLQVYQKSIRLYGLCLRIARLPRDHVDLSRQLRRASLSIVLNIAEGAGEYTASEKSRFYRIAKRSATETSAAIDAVEVTGCADPKLIGEAQALLADIVRMLTRMSQNLERGLSPAARKPK